MLYSLEAGTDPVKPVLGALVSMNADLAGEATVEFPTRRIVATHWRIAGWNDPWTVCGDRLVAKSLIPVRDLQYLLVAAEGALHPAR